LTFMTVPCARHGTCVSRRADVQ